MIVSTWTSANSTTTSTILIRVVLFPRSGGDFMHVGLHGLPMDGDHFDLDDGITIKRTYAHLMMPYLVAFKQAEPGKAHPGPWKSAESSAGFDIEAELC